MQKLNFNNFIKKLKKISFSKFDLIVAIGKGGIVPAVVIGELLNLPVEILWLNFRDDRHNIIHKRPKLIKKNLFLSKIKNKKILLVDDVSRSGKTLEEAKRLLKGNKVKTFVINGEADYNIINCEECVGMVWK